MKALLTKPFGRKTSLLLLSSFMAAVASLRGSNPYEETCNHYNVFTLTAESRHDASSCPVPRAAHPHCFIRLSARFISEAVKDKMTKGEINLDNLYLLPAIFQGENKAVVDIPLIDDVLTGIFQEDFRSFDPDKMYLLVFLHTKTYGNGSRPEAIEHMPDLADLRQIPSEAVPVGGNLSFDAGRPILIKFADMLKTTLSTSIACQTLTLGLASKCPLVINNTQTVYKGYPYRVSLNARAACAASEFVNTPETFPVTKELTYTDNAFGWEYIHGDMTAFKPLKRRGATILVNPLEDKELPFGKNILVKIVDGRPGDTKNTKTICFYPDIPQPTKTKFQQIPEGSDRLQELTLTFDRKPNDEAEEKLTLLTVYSKIGRKSDGTPDLGESVPVFQESIDMRKFNGLNYTVSVANHPMKEGTYHVTVEGTARNRSNNPNTSENHSLPAEIKNAMFQAVPVVVGKNEINIEKTEFTPPDCFETKGKLKITLGEYFLPLISKNPVFYYRTGTDPDGTILYDTIHFKCTYMGTRDDPHATFECDHVDERNTYFKVVIPAILSSAGGGSGSLSLQKVPAGSSSPHSDNDRSAYFQIGFSRPGRIQVPVEVKHNSGFYHVNRKLQMADDGKVTVFREHTGGGTPPYRFYFRDEFAYPSLTVLSNDVIPAPNAGIRYISVRDSKGCLFDTSVFVGNLGGQLFVKLDMERAISCHETDDGILRTSLEKKTGNPLGHAWYKDGTLLPGESNSMLYDLGPGNYKVVVTDLKTGMASSDEITLTRPAPLKLDVQHQKDVDCFGDNSGAIALSGSGGTPSYLYLWDGVDYGSLRRDLPAGEYSVKLVDHNSCEITRTYVVKQPGQAFRISIDSVFPAHHDEKGNYTPGRIVLHSRGGTKPYGMLDQGGADLDALDAGTYHLEQRDARQCITSQDVTVDYYDKMKIEIVQDRENLCSGDKDAACHVEITGGVPPFSILWSNGAKHDTVNGLGGGNLSVQVTDAAGVTKTDSLFVHLPLPLSIDSVSMKDPTYHGCTDSLCPPGETDGETGFRVRGGTPPYGFSWKKDGLPAEIPLFAAPRPSERKEARHLGAGHYELTATDRNACTERLSFTLADIPALHAVIETLQETSCHGARDGIIRVKAAGGTPPYRHAWENLPDTNGRLENIPAGNYKVHVSDALGVTASAMLHLDEPEPLRIVVESVKHPSYPGSRNGQAHERENDGEIIVSAKGGNEPYRFLWTDANDSSIADKRAREKLSEGTYHLKLRDASGCMADTAFVLTRTETLFCSIIAEKPVSCHGSEDALLRADIRGGTPPYEIKWLQGGNDSIGNGTFLENRGGGLYALLVCDRLGVQAYHEFDLPQPDSLRLRLTTRASLCQGDNDGKAVATVEGGTAPYTYRWNVNGKDLNRDSAVIDHVENAKIKLNVSDSRGCPATAAAAIVAPSALELEYSAVDPSYGSSLWQVLEEVANDGRIDLFASGGTSPYRYVWRHGDRDRDGASSITDLDSGFYLASVIDKNDCRATREIRLRRTPPLETRLLSVREPLCADSQTAAFELHVKGGKRPYAFDWFRNGKWIGEDSVRLKKGMGAGVYKVVVRDANGIVSRDSLPVGEPERISVTANIEDATAWTLANGSIHVRIRGGVRPYQTLWNDGNKGTELEQARRGTYMLEVQDANRCRSTYRYMVNSPDSLFISSWVVQDRTGEKRGAIRLSLEGGLPPYTYDWQDGSGKTIRSGSDKRKRMEITDLEPGIYRFHVRDSGGATLGRLFEIKERTRMQAAILLENGIHCHGGKTAVVQAWINGGRAPYVCLWSRTDDTSLPLVPTGKDGTRLENLPAGTYRIQVRDADEDSCSAQITIGQAEPLRIHADIQPSDVPGQKGKFVLRPQGGRPPYAYLWNTGNKAATQEFSNQESYQATVTDAEGCTAFIDLDSVLSRNLRVQIHPTSEIRCFGDSTGSLRVDISDGKPPFAVRWSNGATSHTASGLGAGKYMVRVTDAGGHADSASFQLRQPGKLHNAIVTGTPSCHGLSDGSIRLHTTGGSGQYLYAWNTGAYTRDLYQLAKGTYVVRVSDKSQCALTDTIVLDEPERLLCLPHVDSIACPDEKGRISWHASGGTSPYRYQWTRLAGKDGRQTQARGNAPLIEPADAGWYELTVEDGKRCTFDTGIHLGMPFPPAYELAKERSLCIGQCLELEAAGSDTVPGLRYLWVYPDGTVSDQPAILTRMAGLHRLTLIQNLRCVYRDSVMVSPFDDSIHAEFWVSSQIAALQNCLLVNLSGYHPDSIAWHVPEEAVILNREGNYLEIRFPEAGTYTIGMTSYKGRCSESTYRQVEVFDAQRQQEAGNRPDGVTWRIQPNPVHASCRLTGESDRRLLVRHRLVRTSTGEILRQGTFDMPAGKISKTILDGHEPAGMYILLLEYGTEKRSLKIVKI